MVDEPSDPSKDATRVYYFSRFRKKVEKRKKSEAEESCREPFISPVEFFEKPRLSAESIPQ